MAWLGPYDREEIKRSVSSSLVLLKKRTRFIIGTLLCIALLLGMAVDLVAPSLPSIASSLHVSAEAAKNVITLYLLGYALGSFFSGFLTDALGRKHILRVGLLSFFLASLLPVLFPNIVLLLLARFLQGLAIGPLAVVARAVFSDILPPEKIVRIGILMGSVFGAGTVIGPLIGGYLQFYGGWKACFVFFALFALICLIVILPAVPETHFQRHPLNLKTIQRNLLEVISHQQFIALVLIMGSLYSLMIAFNTVGPFLIQTKFHHTSIFFGTTALWLGLAFLGATFLCRFCVKKYQLKKLFFVVIHLSFCVALVSLLASFFFKNSILLLIGTSLVMFFSTGFIYPMSFGKGTSLFRHIAGTATAMMYLFNILMISLTAFLLSLINVQSISAMVAIYVALLTVCVFVYWKFIHDQTIFSTH